MEAFREHLEHPVGRGLIDGALGVAGGSLCGDLVSMSVRVDGTRVAVGWEASGCGATSAAASACASLAGDVMASGRISVARVSAELGGLSPGKLHAAELVCDAFHSAMGVAVRETAALKEDGARVAVAMSGGVDSAVAALLVGSGGFGVTVELWRDPDNDASASCCSASAVRAARALAHGLGIPHFTLDLREEFRAGVVEPWLADHAAGLTPNPCVRCNGHVRLDAMLDFAQRLGAPALATGHYARKDAEGRLRAAADPAKDQAYMLAATSPETLARLRFPLGELTKPEVRALAAEAGLPVAGQAESQDLCFLAGTGKAAFVAKHGAADTPGDIVRDGVVVGRHAGQQGFTVGQRRGLRVAAAEPLYVLAKEGSTVVVGVKEQLQVSEVGVRDAVLADSPDSVRLRYRSRAVPCSVEGEAPDLRLTLAEPVHGVAPGQVAVLYRGDTVVGHGVIS
ncbi:MAG: tRNA-uridine 2-sulfurtransferase [Solirubrobacteraceae bacterium]|nr:tRNA-uridine 2-sulfurtransferase [Solirubrobacteraceae bacterium]